MVKKAKAAREEQSEDAVVFAKRAEELRLSGDALFAQGKCVAPGCVASSVLSTHDWWLTRTLTLFCRFQGTEKH